MIARHERVPSDFLSLSQVQAAGVPQSAGSSRAASLRRSRRVFRFAWYGVNIVLSLSLIALIWSMAWEYSTQRYLKGFSDAIVPFSAQPVQKVQAILNWMSHTPQRFGQAPAGYDDDRDPTETLNYASLLKVCGTATNAFINLADSGGLTVRRLLLLDENRSTVHVVAEVLVNDRWIVVDPTYHTIFRGPDGTTLTSAQLVAPAVFRFATQNVVGYQPTYVFDHAVHIRLAQLGPLGRALRNLIGVPGWEGLPFLSLILERKSLEVTILFSFLLFFSLLFRVFLRWYGEKRLGIRTTRLREKMRRVSDLLLEPAAD